MDSEVKGIEGRQWFVYHDEEPWTVVAMYATFQEALEESVRMNFGALEEPDVLYWVADRREYYERVLGMRPPEDVVTC